MTSCPVQSHHGPAARSEAGGDLAVPSDDAGVAASLSDQQLIAACKSGDRSAFGELVARHRKIALGYAARLAGPHEAEDLVSEACVRILAGFARGSGPDSNFRAYLLTSVFNRHVQGARSRGRELPIEDLTTLESTQPIASGGEAELLERAVVARAFAALPTPSQAALWATEILEYPLAEVATLLRSNANATAAAAYRARESLRRSYLAAHLAPSVDTECSEVLAVMPALVRETLTSSRSAAAVRHVVGCESCARALDELEELNARMPSLRGTRRRA